MINTFSYSLLPCVLHKKINKSANHNKNESQNQHYRLGPCFSNDSALISRETPSPLTQRSRIKSTWKSCWSAVLEPLYLFSPTDNSNTLELTISSSYLLVLPVSAFALKHRLPKSLLKDPSNLQFTLKKSDWCNNGARGPESLLLNLRHSLKWK